MQDIIAVVLVPWLCAGTTIEPGYPDTGDGIGGAIAISGFMVSGTNALFV